jgi:hypothetical protein
MSKIWVKVPKSKHGLPARLRRRGGKRLRFVDTDEEIKAGLNGGPSAAGTKVAEPTSDYFTEKPEQVEFDTWVERQIRKGNLEECAAPASQPVAATAPKTKATAGEPVLPLTNKE